MNEKYPTDSSQLDGIHFAVGFLVLTSSLIVGALALQMLFLR